MLKEVFNLSSDSVPLNSCCSFVSIVARDPVSDGILIQAGATTNPTDATDFILFRDGDGTAIGAIDGNSGGGVNFKSYAGDYAEWFEAEEEIAKENVVGLNLKTGKMRNYRRGDPIIGVISTNPIVVGNHKEGYDEDPGDMVLVALLGQVKINPEKIKIKGHIVMTFDGVRIGYMLPSGTVLLNMQRKAEENSRQMASLDEESKKQQIEIENLKIQNKLLREAFCELNPSLKICF